MGITFENDEFQQNSNTLLEDIEQTYFQKKKKETQTLTKSRNKLVLNEMADLNR